MSLTPEDEEALRLLEHPPGAAQMKMNLAALSMKLAQLGAQLRDQDPDWASICIAASETLRTILRDADAWPPAYEALLRAAEVYRLSKVKPS